MNIGIISQARMTSSRLKGKIMRTAAHKPILHYHVHRALQSNYPVYIATTTNTTDDIVTDWCAAHHIPYYRGSEDHVLSRYFECAKLYNLDLIVRITSDCPLIDGRLIEQGIAQYIALNDPQTYISNGIQRTFPRGFDFEIFSFELLAQAYQNAHLAVDIEHVTPYLHQNRSGKVRIVQVLNQQDKSQYRITLDTPEDYRLLKILIEQYHAHLLSYTDIIELLDQHPELVLINAHIEQKKLGE